MADVERHQSRAAMIRLFVAIALLACLLAANAVVTFRLWQSASYNGRQKASQTLIVWLLPVLGSMLVGAFLREPSNRTYATTEGGLGEMGVGDLWTNADLVGHGVTLSDADPS